MTVPCLVCKDDLDQVSGIQVHPGCEVNPDVAAVEIYSMIGDAIINQPRSLQRMIGPSEIGHPCTRRIAYKLAGTPDINSRGVAWKPFVGTAVHEQMANIFAKAEVARWGDGSMDGIRPRWHVEERVTVGQVGGVDVTGSCDLFDAALGIVYDHKYTTTNMIRRKYKVHGPGDQYSKQAHLYGRGFALQGFDVRFVAILFGTRDGEFSDRYFWYEEYDEQVAIDALDRLAMIKSVVDMLGSAAPATFDPVASYCQHCPFFKLGATDLDRACPGDPADVETHRVDISDPFGSR